jgi:hypothetical protein
LGWLWTIRGWPELYMSTLDALRMLAALEAEGP